MDFTADDEGAMTISIQNQMIAELPSLKAYASALTADNEAASGLVDKTATHALTRLDEAANAPSLRAWLCGQARRAFRPVNGQRRDMDPDLTRRVAASAGTSAERLVMTETLRALFTLPILDREAVMLVDVLGLSPAEAATVAKCTAQAVAARQARARAALRNRLHPDAPKVLARNRTGRSETRATA
jgi:RNA polymerase sigma-70 factor (ECF subfamily)